MDDSAVVKSGNIAPAAANRSVMQMTWTNLLFVHWPIPIDLARRLVPKPLEVDTFEGQAWIGLVPFGMEQVRHRFLAVPTMRNFLECNVRTYARHGDERGVWFCSLDASSRVAVFGARWLWRLNYRQATITCHVQPAQPEAGSDCAQTADEAKEQVTIDYTVQRRDHHRRTHIDQHAVDGSVMQPSMRACWQPGERLPRTQPGELLHFLTERYVLFALSRRGEVRIGRIEHEPWSLRAAKLLDLDDSLVASMGITSEQRTADKRLVIAADPITVHAQPLQTASA